MAAGSNNIVTDGLIGCWDAGTVGAILRRVLRGLIRWVALKAHSLTTILLVLTPLRVDISSLLEQMGALTVVII